MVNLAELKLKVQQYDENENENDGIQTLVFCQKSHSWVFQSFGFVVNVDVYDQVEIEIVEVQEVVEVVVFVEKVDVDDVNVEYDDDVVVQVFVLEQVVVLILNLHQIQVLHLLEFHLEFFELHQHLIKLQVI